MEGEDRHEHGAAQDVSFSCGDKKFFAFRRGADHFSVHGEQTDRRAGKGDGAAAVSARARRRQADRRGAGPSRIRRTDRESGRKSPESDEPHRPVFRVSHPGERVRLLRHAPLQPSPRLRAASSRRLRAGKVRAYGGAPQRAEARAARRRLHAPPVPQSRLRLHMRRRRRTRPRDRREKHGTLRRHFIRERQGTATDRFQLSLRDDAAPPFPPFLPVPAENGYRLVRCAAAERRRWYAILARKHVEALLQSGRLRVIPIRGEEIPPVQHYMVYRKESGQQPAVQKFISAL